MIERQTEYGPELFCRHCPNGGEWWPATEEFFYIQHGKLASPCKACQAETRLKNASLPCCVPGCTNPRHVMKSRVESRCLDHLRQRRSYKYSGNPRYAEQAKEI